MANQPYWNPSDKDSDVTLSNGDRTWQQSAGTVGAVRSTVGLSSGKWRVQLTQITANGSACRHGFATGSHSIAVPPGNTGTNSWAINGQGTLEYNGTSGNDYANYANNGVVSLYIDIGAGKIWYGDASGPYAGDPAAGTGAMHTFTPGTTVYLCGGMDGGGSTRGGTLRLLADYSGSPPSGFTDGWGTTGGSVGVELTAGDGRITVTGRPATVATGTGQVLAAGGGAVAVAGGAVGLVAGTGVQLAAGPGAVAVTGAPAAVTAGQQLAAGPAAVVATGQAAAARTGAGVLLAAGPGAILFTGHPATADVSAAVEVTAGVGRYLAAGAAAALVAGQVLAAAADGIAVTGGAVTLATGTGQLLQAGAAQVTVTGRPVGLVAGTGVRLGVGPGAVAWTGAAAAVVAGQQLAPAPAALDLTGQPATVRVGTGVLGAPAAAAVTVAGGTAALRSGTGVLLAAGAGGLAVEGRAVGLATGTGVLLAAGTGGVTVAGRPVGTSIVSAYQQAAQAGRLALRQGRAAVAAGAPLRPPVPTPGDLDALLAGPRIALNWVVVLHPWDAEAGALATVRWGTRDVTTGPAQDPPSTRIPGRLADVSIRQALWQGGELFGRSSPATARVVVDDQAGEWRHLATEAATGGGRRWHFRRRQAEIRLGHPDWDWADYQPVLTGEVEEVEFSDGRIRFDLRDRLRRLDEPLSEAVFRGNRVLAISSSTVTVGPGAKSFTLPDLVSNGGFASSLTGWYAGSGWAQSGGAAVKTAGAATGLVQEVATAADNRYRLRATVTRSAGSLQPTLDGRPLGSPLSAAGTVDVTFVARGSTSKIGFLADSAFAGSVDAVTCRLEPEAEAGDPVIVARTSNLSGVWMDGVVVSWTPATGVLATQISAVAGEGGSHADWSIWVRPDEGGADLAGQALPVLLGTVRHVEPVELGSVQGLWLWRLADGPVRVDPAAGHGVFDGGEPLDLAASFPPAAGEAFVDGARGRLWTYSRPALVLSVTAESLVAARTGVAEVRAAVDLDGVDDWYEDEIGTGEPGVRYESKGSLAVRFRVDDGDFLDRTVFHFGGPLDSGLSLYLNGSNEPTLYFNWYTAGEWTASVGTAVTAGAGWHRLLAAWDLSVPRLTVLLDGVPQTISGTPTGAMAPLAFGAGSHRIGRWDSSDPSPYAWDGALTEFWYAHGTELDLDDAAVVARFETADGSPADLGEVGQLPTGSAPYCYHWGNPTQFALNRGTGPQFEAVSAPATASTTPYAPPDVVELGETATAAGLLEAVLRERLGLAPGDLDGAAFAALAAAAPARLGRWLAEPGAPARELVDQLLATVGAWIDTDPDGVVTVGRYDGPAVVADHRLDERLLLAVPRRLPVAAALWRRRIGAERCWRPHGSTEIAGAASDAVRAFLRQEWREGLAEDQAVRQADLGAEDVFLEACFDRRSDAEAEAARQLALLSPAAIGLQADAGPPALTWRLGATVDLVCGALGLAAGRRLVLVDREVRRDGTVTLTLLG